MATIIKEEAMKQIAEKTGMIMPKDLSDTVINTLEDYQKNGQLVLPKNYSPVNALKSAYLMIMNDENMAKCTFESKTNVLLDMVILGLNPAKGQCYFIPRFGNTKLTLFVSYFGKQTILKRMPGIGDIQAQPIYEGDDVSYEIEDGRVHNIKHIQKFGNIDDKKIIGGYCTIEYNGKIYGQIRTMAQIKDSWSMTEKSTKEKFKFEGEFTKRTLVNTTIKWFIRARDDQDIMTDTYDKVTEEEYITEEEIITEPTEKTHKIVNQPEVVENRLKEVNTKQKEEAVETERYCAENVVEADYTESEEQQLSLEDLMK